MKGILVLFFLVLLPINALGGDPVLKFEDIQNQPRDNTECATGAFADALSQTANTVSEYDDEQTIQQWIYATFSDKAVLERALACSEIANADDNDTIKFMPIQYLFPGGREIVVNYETQPKILKQRIRLADKRGTPSSDPNPRIGTDNAVWTNIDPAWYAIMVTEHGALNNFVGPDKNNTISLDYIKSNIDSLFPSGRGGKCTDRSAKSRDNTMINKTVRDKTVDIKDDTNDYYVAGDVNLQWLSYMEIALDVALTVVTMGGSQAITGITKAARASRSLKNLTTTIKQLEKIDTVTDYVKLSSRLDVAKAANNADEIADITKRMADLENADDNVKLFKQSTDAVKDINKYLDALKAMKGLRKTKQTGNIIARGFKGAKATAQSLKAVNTGTKTLDKAAKIARKGMKTGRINDWLFQSTMKNIGALGRLGTGTGILYGALKFMGGMYDWTETSTGDFTNNIEFAPLLLLSADDLQGQENVVNHGMWLMWAGDSTSPTDDDAAFLQAMDFASKFHEDLMENQNDSNSPCNIDIWVVKPIIRDPGTEHQALYYLVMNDVPWTTGE
ncbi:MAG: hypothetical protein IKB05_01095 [Alphaproteobacteria bacterium]|nr:hypothetical protein [Alphaproteobacteria bacterium]